MEREPEMIGRREHDSAGSAGRCVWAMLTFALALLPWPGVAPAKDPPPRPIPEIERAVVISIDGCRPDVLLRANTPNVHRLFESGTFTFWARTTEMSITLPSH